MSISYLKNMSEVIPSNREPMSYSRYDHIHNLTKGIYKIIKHSIRKNRRYSKVPFKYLELNV